jgi:hypothetical protein
VNLIKIYPAEELMAVHFSSSTVRDTEGTEPKKKKDHKQKQNFQRQNWNIKTAIGQTERKESEM